MRWNQLTPPKAQDALTAVAAIIAMYGLLIQVDRGIALVALPVIIVVSPGVPAWLLLRYLRNHQVETGFLPRPARMAGRKHAASPSQANPPAG